MRTIPPIAKELKETKQRTALVIKEEVISSIDVS